MKLPVLNQLLHRLVHFSEPDKKRAEKEPNLLGSTGFARELRGGSLGRVWGAFWVTSHATQHTQSSHEQVDHFLTRVI